MSALAPTLQAFFTDRLIRQRQASPHTVAAYRDTFRLLLGFAARSAPASRPPQLDLDDLDAALIGAFLDHLEHDRHNSVRTRNARLAAIHSLFRYAALRHPEHAALIQRVLAIPPKRFDRALVTFLTDAEVDALLAAPTATPGPAAATTPCSLRRRPDRAARLRAHRPHLRRRPPRHRRPRQLPRQRPQGPHHPADHQTVARAAQSGSPNAAASPTDPLFPTRRGRPLSRDAVDTASPCTPPPPPRPARPCTTRRSPPTCCATPPPCACSHAGVDTTVIALWLGHEQLETTQIYLHADLAIKERALARTTPADTTPGRYRPPDPSSPSSKPSDYADLASPNPFPHNGFRPDSA